MGGMPSTAATFAAIILSMAYGCIAEIDPSRSEPNQNYCSTDDLNHSILVECNESSCVDASSEQAIWPNDDKEVIHMYSTREGERFVVNKLPSLSYQEPEHVRMFDINNTLYVRDSNQPDDWPGQFRGFGTTMNIERLLSYIKEGSFDKNYGPILRDLFSHSPDGIGFSILRIPLTRALLLSDTKHIIDLLTKIDDSVLNMEQNVSRSKIKVLVSLEDVDDGFGLLESLASLSRSLKESRRLTCWAVAINKEMELRDDDLLPIDIRKLFATDMLFDTTSLATIKQAPNSLNGISGDKNRGILIKTEFSTPYNIFASLKKLHYENDKLTINGFKSEVVSYGDWKNAQNYAVSILNNLRYGSNGFIEDISDIGIFADTKSQDSSIYSLRNDHNIHFRGPMYYAIGQFSQHIIEGSRRLEISVTSAPNMFAAHYMAFSVPSRNVVVAIVLNDNEHLLPFRLAVDGKIKVFTDLRSKSFNTFVVK